MQFGRYFLEQQIASGGMGEVFLAHLDGRDGLSRQLVIKRVLPQLRDNEQMIELFLSEARTVASLDHPNIAQIFELGEVEGNWYLALEYVPGQDLARTLRAHKNPLPIGVSCRVLSDVAAGLDHAHKAKDLHGRPLGIIHRDVSPQNVLLGFHGGAKLIDFGVAKAIHSSHTVAGVLRGKTAYMSPEQIRGERLDHRADLFSLGIVFWELLAGARLFKAVDSRTTLDLVQHLPVRAPSELNPAVPRALDELCLWMLSRDREQRPHDCAEVRLMVENFVARDGVDASSAVLERFLRELFPDRAAGLLKPGETDQSLHTLAHSMGEVTVDLRPERRPISDPSAEVTSDVPNYLPAASSKLVGRRTELRTTVQLLASGPLVTLVGPAGAGKTRLALECARDLVGPRYPGGAFFCDLSAAQDLDGFCAVVGQSLGVPLGNLGSGTDAVAQIGAALAGRGALLLVLDNVDHLVGFAGAAVGQWAAKASEAAFLSTSREALGLPEEKVVQVGPLEADSHDSEAVRLFVDRALQSRPSWAPGPGELEVVAEIVRALDGLPLAIELAAARMAVLTPRQIRERLPRRFELLRQTNGVPGSGLREAIGWSFQSLRAWERDALKQCATFRGGFTAELAQQVVLLDDPQAPPVTRVVEGLREKSLLFERDDRYHLYESVRAFAEEQSSDAGAERRHASAFAELAGPLSLEVEWHAEAAALRWLAAERENLMAAFSRMEALGPGDGQAVAVAVAVALALDPVLLLRGPSGEHQQTLERALNLARKESLPAQVQARLGELLGRSLQSRGRTSESVAEHEAALLVADPATAGRLHSYIGTALRLRGKMVEAAERYRKALELLRSTGQRRMEGRTLGALGALFQETGAFDEARSHYLEAIEIHREVRDRRFEGIALGNLGALEQDRKGLEESARARYQEALQIHQEVGNRRSEGIAMSNLGSLDRELGAFDSARSYYLRALDVHREVGDVRFVGIAHYNLGGIEHERTQLDEAVSEYAKALAIFRQVGDRRYQGLLKGFLAAAHAAKGMRVEAETELEEATALLADVGDASFAGAVAVCAVRVKLARAERGWDAKHVREALEAAQPNSALSGYVREAIRCLWATPVQNPDPNRQPRPKRK